MVSAGSTVVISPTKVLMKAAHTKAEAAAAAGGPCVIPPPASSPVKSTVKPFSHLSSERAQALNTPPKPLQEGEVGKGKKTEECVLENSLTCIPQQPSGPGWSLWRQYLQANGIVDVESQLKRGELCAAPISLKIALYASDNIYTLRSSTFTDLTNQSPEAKALIEEAEGLFVARFNPSFIIAPGLPKCRSINRLQAEGKRFDVWGLRLGINLKYYFNPFIQQWELGTLHTPNLKDNEEHCGIRCYETVTYYLNNFDHSYFNPSHVFFFRLTAHKSSLNSDELWRRMPEAQVYDELIHYATFDMANWCEISTADSPFPTQPHLTNVDFQTARKWCFPTHGSKGRYPQVFLTETFPNGMMVRHTFCTEPCITLPIKMWRSDGTVDPKRYRTHVLHWLRIDPWVNQKYLGVCHHNNLHAIRAEVAKEINTILPSIAPIVLRFVDIVAEEVKEWRGLEDPEYTELRRPHLEQIINIWKDSREKEGRPFSHHRSVDSPCIRLLDYYASFFGYPGSDMQLAKDSMLSTAVMSVMLINTPGLCRVVPAILEMELQLPTRTSRHKAKYEMRRLAKLSEGVNGFEGQSGVIVEEMVPRMLEYNDEGMGAEFGGGVGGGDDQWWEWQQESDQAADQLLSHWNELHPTDQQPTLDGEEGEHIVFNGEEGYCWERVSEQS